MIAYQTAFLKRHYPREYMAALLSSVLGQPEKIAEYAAECREMGIQLLPPDVNESGAMFSVSGDNLRYGLVAVKNIGRGFISEMTAERERNGPFADFEEFCRRMYGGDLNRRALESLIKCGCFDGLGANRRQLMTICQTVIDSIADSKRRNVEGQIDLFGISGDIDGKRAGGMELPDLPEYPKGELMRMEHEVTGLYLSGHPMDEYRSAAKGAGAASIGEILLDFAREEGNLKFADDQQIKVAGIVEAVRTKPTRNDTLMAYITLDDGSGSIEMLAFQRVIDASAGCMQVGAPVVAAGRLSARDEKEPQIVVDSLRPISDLQVRGERREERGEFRDSSAGPGVVADGVVSRVPGAPPTAEKKLFVKLRSAQSPEYDRLKLVHIMFPGREQLIIHFEDTKKNVGSKCIIHEAFVNELREMLGENNVVVK